MKTVVNFRDLGGITTSKGKTVKANRILRSGELVDLASEDKLKLVDNYGLKSIVDFRSSKEISERPDDSLESTDYYHIDIMKDVENNASKSYFEDNEEFHPDEMMKDVYKTIILDDTATQGYRSFIDVLLNQKEGSTIFHCFAGKDRTGLGAAIILTILGANKEDIINDYLETNVLRKEANDKMLEEKRNQGASEQELEYFNLFMSVKADYLETAFETANEKYGSFLDYIINGIGVSKNEIETLQEMYLV